MGFRIKEACEVTLGVSRQTSKCLQHNEGHVREGIELSKKGGESRQQGSSKYRQQRRPATRDRSVMGCRH